jgi:hypothetical protein
MESAKLDERYWQQRVEADRAVEEVELHSHIRGGNVLPLFHEGASRWGPRRRSPVVRLN